MITPPPIYSWHCLDHHVTKAYGTAQRSMEQGAMKHRQRYPGHKVDLLETRVIYRMGWRDDDQLALIPAPKGVDDAPPF